MVIVHGRQVPVSAERSVDLGRVIKSQRFNQWLRGIDRRFDVRSIHIRTADRAGDKEAAFINLQLEVRMQEKSRLRIANLQGNSVAILVVLVCEGREFAALVCQPREAAGIYESPEIVAGMCDGEPDFAKAARRELAEELGCRVEADKLVDMTALLGDIGRGGLYPSPATSSESVHFFLYRAEATAEELAGFEGRRTGVASEDEHLVVRVVPLDDIPKVSPNMFSVTAYLLYSFLKQRQAL